MEKYTFLDLAEEVLRSRNQAISYSDIWRIAVEMGLDKKLGSSGATPDQTLGAKLYTNVKREDSKFFIVSTRPTLFALKELQNNIREPEVSEYKKKKCEDTEKFHERKLHPLLVRALKDDNQFKIYCKTIIHEKSGKGKSGQDRWNYPDIVGIYFPFGEYKDETLKLLQNLNKTNYKIYSFELKKSLNWGNLKECYFQAVSNSSWANEGYLVTYEIPDDRIEILKELKRLNTSFGIGAIELKEDATLQVLFPARERELDVDTLDMLVEKNPDFRDFIDNINKDIHSNDKTRIMEEKYDKLYKKDDDNNELQKYLIEKKIIQE